MTLAPLLFAFSEIVKFAIHGSLGIAPSSLKLDSWSLETDFYSYYIHQGNKSDKERKIIRTKLSFMHRKGFKTLF